jgi:uncharacterized protein YqeY
MLIETIRADRIAAMKARNEVAKNLLGTLVGAATKDSKTPDDELTVRTIRAFLKSLTETVGLLQERGQDTSGQKAEIAILEAYLPRQLSMSELEASINEIVAGLPERSPKAMGQVMAALKSRHGSSFDARAANGLVKAALA